MQPNSNNISTSALYTFYGLGILSVVSLLLASIFEQKIAWVLPVLFPLAYIALTDIKKIYFALLFVLPFSIEYQVSSSLATDLPTEPLMAGLLLVLSLVLIKKLNEIDFSFFKNAIFILLAIHFFWLFITSLTSLTPIISFKFLLAKTWYIFAFFLGTALFIQGKKDLKKLFWIVFIPLTITVLWSLAWHSLTQFHFSKINWSLAPFYRNHVVYANLLTIFLPFIFLARTWYAKGSAKRRWLNIGVFIYFIAIYFAYTRASYLAVIAMAGAYFIIHFRMMKIAFLASILLVAGIFSVVTYQNYYLKYSPTVKTVTHHSLTDIMDATLKGRDVSSMERIYRWIAGIHMVNDRPITGFGPNGFVPNYKNYTVFLFETWISDNEEKSGVHNYFLMTAIEQGLFGLLVWVLLLFAFFAYGENFYHKSQSKDLKNTTRAILLSMVAVVVSLIFSDMIEVDKTGSFFFINLALLILVSRNYKGLLPKIQKN